MNVSELSCTTTPLGLGSGPVGFALIGEAVDSESAEDFEGAILASKYFANEGKSRSSLAS